MRVRVEFKPQDLWVGLFWRRETIAAQVFGWDVDLWICLVPMFPLHVSWHYGGLGDDEQVKSFGYLSEADVALTNTKHHDDRSANGGEKRAQSVMQFTSSKRR